MNFLDDLIARKLLHQSTDLEELRKEFSRGTVTAYIGFDPTAPSLHVGSLLQIILLARLQRAGHRPIALVGGGTGLIGDPSGKQAERTLLTREALDVNLRGIRKQLGRYLEVEAPANPALVVDNSDWLGSVGLLDFLRDFGKHFSVNAMVQRDAVKKRLEERNQGISYTEFSYMLLQAYDFVALHDRRGCSLQLGGSDQWGNIVSGVDLVRRTRGATVHGLTVPLIASADGTKFGKTEKGAVWLDPELTSPFEFYQLWLNTADEDVERYLNFFTFFSPEDIGEILASHQKNPGAREAQNVLAAEVTTFVHGIEGYEKAAGATRVFFGKAATGGAWEAEELASAFTQVPACKMPREHLGTAEASLVRVLAATGLFPSRMQARVGIGVGSVSVNGTPVTNPLYALSQADCLAGGYVVLRRGKKSFSLVHFG